MSWALHFDLVSFILENSCSQPKWSRMQPQSSSHYPPAQENAWSGEYASSKNLHDRHVTTAAKRDFSSSEHCRSTSSICTSDGADSTSTSKGEVKSLKSSLYSILLNNLSLLRYRCLHCHGYLGSDKRRATEASDWPLQALKMCEVRLH